MYDFLLCSLSSIAKDENDFLESSLKMLKHYMLFRGGRSTFENNQSFPFALFFSVVEFVQWVLHSFLKKHLLSQWDSGDFALQLLCSLTATCYGFKIIPSHSVLRKTRGKRCSSGFTVTHSTLFTIWSLSNIWKLRLFDQSECLLFFFKGDLSGNGTGLCPFERCCRGQLWEGSPWTDKSGELSLCLSCCSNLECIIKGEACGRVLESVFSLSCKSCEFIVAMTLGLRSYGFHWCSEPCLLWSCR